jgi:microcystin-dependent protein
MKGRVPIGLDSTQTEFDTLGEVGGAKTVTLAVTEMPLHGHSGNTGGESANHTHAESAHTHTTPAHTHALDSTSTTAVATGTASGGTTENSGISVAQGLTTGRFVHPTTIAGNTSSGGSGTSGSTTPPVTGGQNVTHTHTIASEGGGGSHNNLQPYMVLNYIIKT